MKTSFWKKYSLEFFSIFFAVISAFALNNWNDHRKDNEAEAKILSEIVNGLKKDGEDIASNITGHEQGLAACKYWRRTINGEELNQDTIGPYYYALTRDFVSIQNTSGYETLKSRGFELLDNDSLRSKIISLYEYEYQILEKLEEEYAENQFHTHYFPRFNDWIAPHLNIDVDSNVVRLSSPIALDETQQKILLSYLWKIQMNRGFMLGAYHDVQAKIAALREEIEVELER